MEKERTGLSHSPDEHSHRIFIHWRSPDELGIRDKVLYRRRQEEIRGQSQEPAIGYARIKRDNS